MIKTTKQENVSSKYNNLFQYLIGHGAIVVHPDQDIIKKVTQQMAKTK